METDSNCDEIIALSQQLKVDYEHILKKVEEEEASLTQIEKTLADTEEAQQLLQLVAQRVQESAHEQVATVVTRCLEAIFGEGSYTFKINFLRKRGKTEAELFFEREGHEVEPTTAAGGGCLDIAAFALRLAVLVLAKPRKRRLLVLDEPLRNLSSIYRPMVPDLLRTLAEELDLQLILSTNFEEYVVGKPVRVDHD